MNKKGFTLVELLAVIVILAIVLIIAVPNIFNIITKTKKDALDIDAANIARNLDAKVLSGEINIATFTKEDLDSIGVDSTKYEGFGVSLVNDKVVVSLAKDNYVGENRLDSKVYGVIFNGTSSTLTRTDDSVGLTTLATATSITSDFDYEEIYSEISEVVDTYGNVFIRIPKFWIKKTNKGAVWTYQISRTKQDNSYYLPACFYDETSGKIVSYILVGKYEASLGAGDKLESKSGKTVQVSKTITAFRDYARNNNVDGLKGYQQMDIHVVDILQTLFYVEFATFHSQGIMAGFTGLTSSDSKVDTGTTDNVGSNLSSGSPTSNTNGLYTMKYRGIENVWGNTNTFIDGININNRQAYVARNANLYEEDKFDEAYIPLNYVNAKSDNYAKAMGYDPNNPFVQMPTSVTSSAGSSPYYDFYYQGAGEMVVVFGGPWYGGSYAGLSYWLAYYGSGYANTSRGARLVKVPI